MLYEVVTKANLTGIDGQEFLRRLPEGREYMGKLRKQGAILHSWLRVGGYGATTIFSVGSHEELIRLLYGNPLVPHVSFDVIPLVAAEDYEGLDQRAAP